jgi:hypothetical protein
VKLAMPTLYVLENPNIHPMLLFNKSRREKVKKVKKFEKVGKGEKE